MKDKEVTQCKADGYIVSAMDDLVYVSLLCYDCELWMPPRETLLCGVAYSYHGAIQSTKCDCFAALDGWLRQE